MESILGLLNYFYDYFRKAFLDILQSLVFTISEKLKKHLKNCGFFPLYSLYS
jgi:hypothetical protein